MVRLGSFLLASAFGAQTLWAASIPKIHLDERDVRHVYKRGSTVSAASWCPEQLGREIWECDNPYCGGEDPKYKGTCTLGIHQPGPRTETQIVLVNFVHCKCGPKGSGGGSHPPPIIVIPPPVGFVPPPAGVPSVTNPNQCPEDYGTTSCSDCKPLQGWCTVGPHAGCPCREECPTEDDKKPGCADETCLGEDAGTCTVGHYLDCQCKKSCPDLEQVVLDCAATQCKKDANKETCTADGPYKDCPCSVAYHDPSYLPGTAAEMTQIRSVLAGIPKMIGDQNKPPPKPNVTCSSNDYSKAVDIDSRFANQMAAKFCNGTDKSATLTNKDIGSSAYSGYTFHFEYTDGNDCTTTCQDVYSTMISSCWGLNSHYIQAEATAKFSCGTNYQYSFTVPKKSTPPPSTTTTAPPAATTTSSGTLGPQQCHGSDEFGSHGDVRGADLSSAAMGCAMRTGDQVTMMAGKPPIKQTVQYGGTWLQFIISWVDRCQGPAQDIRFPLGGQQILGNSCWQLFLNDWQNCNNGGAGGYIDAGCVRYDFRPTNQ